MKDRILIKELPSHIGESIRIAGWIHSTRKQGTLSFLLIRDRSGIAQVIASGKDIADYDIRNETVVLITGEVIEDERAKTGVEIKLEGISVISRPQKKLPLLVKVKAVYQNLEL